MSTVNSLSFNATSNIQHVDPYSSAISSCATGNGFALPNMWFARGRRTRVGNFFWCKRVGKLKECAREHSRLNWSLDCTPKSNSPKSWKIPYLSRYSHCTTKFNLLYFITPKEFYFYLAQYFLFQQFLFAIRLHKSIFQAFSSKLIYYYLSLIVWYPISHKLNEPI